MPCYNKSHLQRLRNGSNFLSVSHKMFLLLFSARLTVKEGFFDRLHLHHPRDFPVGESPRLDGDSCLGEQVCIVDIWSNVGSKSLRAKVRKRRREGSDHLFVRLMIAFRMKLRVMNNQRARPFCFSEVTIKFCKVNFYIDLGFL